MTRHRKVEADQGQSTSYKDWMFQRLAEAENPHNACWRAVETRLLSALKEIVRDEVTAVTFPDSAEKRGAYVPYDKGVFESSETVKTQSEQAETEKNWGADEILGGIALQLGGDEDLERLLSDNLVDYAFAELEPRQKLILFFRQHEVRLNRIPFDNSTVREVAGTGRFQALYDEVDRIRDVLLNLAKSFLKTSTMSDADVDPYETMLLVKMLLKALMPKINDWAQAENLPHPPFFEGNK